MRRNGTVSVSLGMDLFSATPFFVDFKGYLLFDPQAGDVYVAQLYKIKQVTTACNRPTRKLEKIVARFGRK